MNLFSLRILFVFLFISFLPKVGKGKTSAYKKETSNYLSYLSPNIIQLNISESYLKQRKRRSKGRGSGRRGNGPEGAKLMSTDLFVGPAMNFAFGNFFEFQDAYYGTNSTLFPASVTNTDIYGFSAGAQFRYSPFLEQAPALALLGFGVGVGFLQRGYKSEFKNQNLTLEYIDKTGINESIKANYLSTNLFIRYGNKVYFEIGPSLDWLVSGKLKYELTRETNGTRAYNGPFSTNETKPDQELKSDYLTSGGMGWMFGFGGLFTPMFGARFQTTYNTSFYKEGANLSNLQFSIQATVTIN